MRELRDTTRDVHRRVEAAVGLMDASVDRPRYAAVLQRFRSVYAPLEERVDAVAAVDRRASEVLRELDWNVRRKGGLLDADLEALDEPRRLAGDDPVRDGAFDATVHDAPSLIGALYVTEGATLGGAVIAPHLRATLGESVPCAFFTSYGDEVAPRWAQFRRIARATLCAPGEVERATTAAQKVFEEFAEAFDA
jgi:heme oxygenase